MILVKTLVFNPFSENTFLLYDETKECIIVDPGCYTSEEQEHLKHVINKESLKPVKLINTHCHIDHVLGNSFVKDTYNLPLEIPINDKETLAAVPAYAATYGFPGYIHADADSFIQTNDLISFGDSELKALFVPGHTKGHIALVSTESKICIGGDILFDGSIGRTDLPGGDFDTLINSIHAQLFSLPDDTVVYPGHGPTTTIGHEKKTNPFCAIS